MKHSNKLIKTISMLGFSALFAGSLLAGISFKKDTIEVGAYTNGDAATYYADISDSLSGNDLLSALRKLNKEKRQYTVGYSAMGTTPSGFFKYTDYDPDSVQYDSNNQPYGTKLTTFYSGKSATSGMNREHVWPNTHGGNKVEADIHMPRPTLTSENGSRGSSFYVEGAKTKDNSGWDPAMEDFGLESYRGDSARIVFYCMVATSDLTLTDDRSLSTVGSNAVMGLVSDMLSWNLRYPVLQRERNRNEGAEYLQGNRNPFIDHPEYACKIWGTLNDKTRQVCEGSLAEGISISKSSISLYEGNTATLSATSTDGSNITWTTSDANVVTISPTTSLCEANVTLTGVNAGTATVTATATIDGEEYPATCEVTVKAQGGGGSNEFTKFSGTIEEGNYLITYDNKAMKAAVSSNRLNYTTVSPENDIVENPDASIIWHVSKSNNYWTIYNAAENAYAAATGTKNQAQLLSSGSDDKSLWSISGSSTYEFVNKNNNSSGVNANLRENSTYGFACYGTNIGGELTLYKQTSSAPVKTLESIAVKTSPKVSYTTGETFDPTGLVITATYSDSSTADISYASASAQFSFNPSTSTALKVSDTLVTISYCGKDVDLPITVSESAVFSISATLVNTKTYHPGQTISKSDILVKDNLNNVITDYTFETYQFTYKDAPSGGAIGQKEFSITYGNLSTTLSVDVSRNPRESTNVIIDEITANDLPATTTTYTNFTNVTKPSGAKYAGNSAKDTNGNIQLRSKNSDSGIVSTSSPSNVKSVKITVGSGSNTINVYGSNTAYTSASNLYSTNTQGTFVGSLSSTGTITFTDDYLYVGIRSNSGAIYIRKIEITYGGEDSALNLANYIMYEDTDGQCNTKFDIAKGYFEGLSKSERVEFMTSDDYVIITAKERFEAWAAYKGESIELSNGDYSVTSGFNTIRFSSKDSGTYFVIIAVIAFISASSIVLLISVKKKTNH